MQNSSPSAVLPPDLEPDDEWKRSLKLNIEAGLRSMIGEAKQKLNDELAKGAIGPEERERLTAGHLATLKTIRQLAEEQFRIALERERQERRWASHEQLDHAWSESMMKEQQAILDRIERERKRNKDTTWINTSIPPLPPPPKSDAPSGSSTLASLSSKGAARVPTQTADSKRDGDARPAGVELATTPDEGVALRTTRKLRFGLATSITPDNTKFLEPSEPSSTYDATMPRTALAHTGTLDPTLKKTIRRKSNMTARPVVQEFWKPSITPEEDYQMSRTFTLARRSDTASATSSFKASSILSAALSDPLDALSSGSNNSISDDQEWVSLDRAQERERERERPKYARAGDSSRFQVPPPSASRPVAIQKSFVVEDAFPSSSPGSRNWNSASRSPYETRLEGSSQYHQIPEETTRISCTSQLPSQLRGTAQISKSTTQDQSTTIEANNRQPILSVCFSADGKHVWGGDREGMLRRWKVDDGREIGEAIPAGAPITAVALSLDCGRLICGLSKHSQPNVKVWDVVTHAKVLEFNDGSYEVTSLDISSDSAKLAVGGNVGDHHGQVSVWSMTGDQLVGPLEQGRHNTLIAVRFSPNGDRFAVASRWMIRIYTWTDDGTQILDVLPYSPLIDLSPPLGWSADGRKLFAFLPDGVKCFDSSSGSLLSTLSVPGDSPWTGDSRCSIVLTHDQRFFVIVTKKMLSLWCASTHEQVGSIIEHRSDILSFAHSPTDEYVASGGEDGLITLRNLREILPPLSFLADVSETTCQVTQLPLLNIDRDTFDAWTQGNFTLVERFLTEQILHPMDSSHHAQALAHRALVRSRSDQLDMAISDAAESLTVRPTAIGHVAKAISLVGKVDREALMQVFDLVFRDCLANENQFLLLTKALLLFVTGNHTTATSRVHDLIATADDDTKHYYLRVLGSMYAKQSDYVHAIESLQQAQSISSSQSSPHLSTITLIFGWSFDGLDFTVQKYSCESLYFAGHICEAAEALLELTSTMGDEARMSKTVDEWVSGFTQKCIGKLVEDGDKDMHAKRYDDAISNYTIALSLNPMHRVDLLIKRSKARIQKKLWNDVLEDANEVIELSPASPWGYEVKHEALLGFKRYDEANNTFRDMYSAIERSTNEDIRRLLEKYVSPSQTESAIDVIVNRISRICPNVLIDVETGRPCDGPERMHIFKSEAVFSELMTSMTRGVDEARILRVVAEYFQYVTLSHVWQGREPSFQDIISAKSVQNLDASELNDKLRNFCEVARKEGYRWAWSDTCCIDKTISTVLNESLTLMYMWYEEAAATLIYLAGVDPPSSLGDLTKSRWMTRAWTLQELLASKVVRFYDRNWEPYLNDQRANHKESPEIMGELAKVFQIPLEAINNFHPDSLGVREKLRLASNRDATREEDVAYSLIGIFKSDIKPNYGDREKALGQLLEEIVTRSGEATVLDWTGKSSSYNSCLPASLTVYGHPLHGLRTVEEAEMGAEAAMLQSSLSQSDAMVIYDRITRLPPARFANRRLYLPCIVFAVKKLGVQNIGSDQENHYRARVSGIGYVEFQTSDRLPLTEPRKVVLVHPWIYELCGPRDGVGWESGPEDDDDEESESTSDSEAETGARSAPSSPMHAVPAAKVDSYTRAQQVIVRLKQPFHALLLQQQPKGEFKRVAAEHAIVVPGLDPKINFIKDIRADVLEIL